VNRFRSSVNGANPRFSGLIGERKVIKTGGVDAVPKKTQRIINK
jgi:hypothetical protein